MFDECVIYVTCDIFTQNITKENPKRRIHLRGTSMFGGIILICS